ncbi:hypothetical protein RND81_06G216100 [Saponaria officinalis]
MQELVRLRQQQQTTDGQLQTLVQRLQGMEQRQQQMMSFLAKAVQSPGFLVQFVQQQSESNRRISETNKKRRLKQDGTSESQNSSHSEGQIVKYQPFGNDSVHSIADNFYIGDAASTSVDSDGSANRISEITLKEVPPTSGAANVTMTSETVSTPEFPEVSVGSMEAAPMVTVLEKDVIGPELSSIPDIIENSDDSHMVNYLATETGDDEFMDFDGTIPLDFDIKLSSDLDFTSWLDDSIWEQFCNRNKIHFDGNIAELPAPESLLEGQSPENGSDKSQNVEQLTEQMNHLNSEKKS